MAEESKKSTGKGWLIGISILLINAFKFTDRQILSKLKF